MRAIGSVEIFKRFLVYFYHLLQLNEIYLVNWKCNVLAVSYPHILLSSFLCFLIRVSYSVILILLFSSFFIHLYSFHCYFERSFAHLPESFSLFFNFLLFFFLFLTFPHFPYFFASLLFLFLWPFRTLSHCCRRYSSFPDSGGMSKRQVNLLNIAFNRYPRQKKEERI